MTGNEIRKRFLEYFETKKHKTVRSASLVPVDDPTLLFTNAGMVQFKRTFLGEDKKDYSQAVTSQKCVRAGGKHNDLENVGYTARHHTFFEMLGNFSFGDYFKEKAIEYAWDLLLNVFRLPKEKLFISIYKDDDDAYNIWNKNMGLPHEKIIRCGEKDNFWSMGDTGPCGPCSEIYIDRGEAFGCLKPDCMVGCDCDRYLEIWNLVFMQYNRNKSGELTPLPKPSIDTGMGLERLCAIIQNVPTNYETDFFIPIINTIESLSEKSYGSSPQTDISMKVIADHTRAAAFLICDGVLPSNEGRGYVLRRIMRRAIRYGRNIGLTRPFLNTTAQTLFNIMKPAYPELLDAKAFIMKIIENEEIQFSKTLDNGLRLLNDTLAELKARGVTTVPGEIIFKLYDTFGFPVDIVRDVVRDEDMTLDMDAFDKSMKEQRLKSKSSAVFTQTGDAYKKLSSHGVKSEFKGYDNFSLSSKIFLLVKDGAEASEASSGQSIEIVTESTPFYGESGGQVGDTGKIKGTDFKIKVLNTIKNPTGIIIHKGKVVSGTVKTGADALLEVDQGRRRDIARNHTATHILHEVLQNILGDHVKQAGSHVAHDRLRFDFTHFSRISIKVLNEIEALVNSRIRENIPVTTQKMDMEEAKKTGATALFEEKYGDRVRVVSISSFSRELCGGTHLCSTGETGLFKIIQESSVASGVRRIEALTGAAALSYVQTTERIVYGTAQLIKEKPEKIVERIEKNLADFKSLEKEVDKLKGQIGRLKSESEEDETKEINGVKLITKKVSADTPSALRTLADQLKDKVGSGIFVLGAISGPKVLLLTIVTKDLTGKYHAGKIVKEVAALVGGGGGGRPDMAQAGGTQPENLDMALEKACDIVAAVS